MPTPNGPLQSDAVFVLAEGASTLDPRRHLAAAGGRAGRVTGRPDVRWSKSHGDKLNDRTSEDGRSVASGRVTGTRGAVAAMGPLSQRTPMGHRPRGLQRDGDAWDYFTHDQARSRAYHWGEDGLAGFSDDKQRLCFSLALWNGKDPIIKERIFGLTNSEANHGEDVKEYYFYLDSTPTHSYMKYLYKYPQEAYPYLDLIETNRRRGRKDPEYELLDTGIFDGDRYFDVFVEYAKASPTDILIQISVCNRGPDEAAIHVLPTLWFRNTWTWWPDQPKPSLRRHLARTAPPRSPRRMRRSAIISCIAKAMHACCSPKTRPTTSGSSAQPTRRLMSRMASTIMSCAGRQDAVNPNQTGTKAAAHYQVTRRRRGDRDHPAAAGECGTRCRGNRSAEGSSRSSRRAGARPTTFYRAITPAGVGEDAANVMRQALAGMLWSKQYFFFDADIWLREHGVDPLRSSTAPGAQPRVVPHDQRPCHLDAGQMGISVVRRLGPGVSHARALRPSTSISPSSSSTCCLRGFTCIRPGRSRPTNGISATSIRRCMPGRRSLLYRMEQALRGKTDLDFLKRVFGKLTANFGWWVNRKDRFGRNLFEGGFLGLDNIGVFDRSAPLPTGGYLEQADGTAWVALFCPEHARDRLRAGGARSDL